jgi:uroporphyrinogen decarboxylase
MRKALNHKEPDRVPVDWGVLNIASIHEVAYKNLIEYLGKDESINIHDPIQVLALPSDEIMDMFNVDTRYIIPNDPSTWTLEYNENGDWVNEFGTYYKRVGNYCDFTEFPLAHCVTIEDLKRFEMPDPTDPARFKGLKEKAKDLYENTDYALSGYPAPNLHYVNWTLRGYQNYMLDMAADPAFANYITDMVLDWEIAYMGCYLDEIGEYLDLQWSGGDWGTQTGPLVHPDVFRRDVLPREKKLIQFLKSKSDAKVGYHSCGSIYWCLDDLIDAGIDIIQPVQPSANDMGDLARLKREFGDRVVFHGATDNQGTFHTTPDRVEQNAKDTIKALAPGGGYIFSSCHNIQSNCPPENIIALFGACKKYGNYPIAID